MAGEPFLSPLGDPNARRLPARTDHGPGAFQTYAVRAYRRLGTCAEVKCQHHREGWVTVIPENTDDNRTRADYIRYHSGRRFLESTTSEGWTSFYFPPEQTCFNTQSPEHEIPADLEPVGLLLPGDHRATTGPAHRYDRVDQLVDDMHTDHDRLATIRSRAGTAGR